MAILELFITLSFDPSQGLLLVGVLRLRRELGWLGIRLRILVVILLVGGDWQGGRVLHGTTRDLFSSLIAFAEILSVIISMLLCD